MLSLLKSLSLFLFALPFLALGAVLCLAGTPCPPLAYGASLLILIGWGIQVRHNGLLLGSVPQGDNPRATETATFERCIEAARLPSDKFQFGPAVIGYSELSRKEEGIFVFHEIAWVPTQLLKVLPPPYHDVIAAWVLESYQRRAAQRIQAVSAIPAFFSPRGSGGFAWVYQLATLPFRYLPTILARRVTRKLLLAIDGGAQRRVGGYSLVHMTLLYLKKRGSPHVSPFTPLSLNPSGIGWLEPIPGLRRRAMNVSGIREIDNG